MTTAAVERWGIIGHDDAVRNLATSVGSGRVAHAWLITGPEGVGRTALALAFARALQCEAAPDERPCNVCDACRRVLRGSHPDISVIDLDWQATVLGKQRGDASHARQRISIDTIKLLRQDIVTRPIMGRWKVQILDDAGLLSNDAPDAFLKTLEEPPAFAVIILIAGSIDAVPETIRSRCQHVALGSVPARSIRDALTGRGIDERAVEQIATAARGRVGWALSMAEHPQKLLARREQVEAAFEQLTTPLGRIAISGTIARDHSKKRDRTYEMLQLWTGLWRDALLLHAGLSDYVAYPEVSDRLGQFAGTLDIADLYRALAATQRCMSDLDANVQARIALHAMVMQWPE